MTLINGLTGLTGFVSPPCQLAYLSIYLSVSVQLQSTPYSVQVVARIRRWKISVDRSRYPTPLSKLSLSFGPLIKDSIAFLFKSIHL